MSSFLKGFNKKAQLAKEAKLPLAVPFGLAGAGLGGLAGYGLTSDFFLRADPAVKRIIDRKAKKKAIEPGTKEYDDLVKAVHRSQRIGGTLGLGLAGGLAGASIGAAKDLDRLWEEEFKRYSGGEWDRAWEEAKRRYRHSGRNYYSSSKGQRSSGGYRTGGSYTGAGSESVWKKTLDLSGSETTKAEVKKKFREAARKNHPDLGGSEEKMKKVNDAWDGIQSSSWFQKLAFILRGFEKRAFTVSSSLPYFDGASVHLPSSSFRGQDYDDIIPLISEDMKKEYKRDIIKEKARGLGTQGAMLGLAAGTLLSRYRGPGIDGLGGEKVNRLLEKIKKVPAPVAGLALGGLAGLALGVNHGLKDSGESEHAGRGRLTFKNRHSYLRSKHKYDELHNEEAKRKAAASQPPPAASSETKTAAGPAGFLKNLRSGNKAFSSLGQLAKPNAPTSGVSVAARSTPPPLPSPGAAAGMPKIPKPPKQSSRGVSSTHL